MNGSFFEASRHLRRPPSRPVPTPPEPETVPERKRRVLLDIRIVVSLH